MRVHIFALMPTIASHAKFLPKAVASFESQIYPADWGVTLRVDDNPTETLGAKLNRMCQEALELEATHIILLDDDDIHAPNRVQAQIAPLLRNPNLTMTGTSVIIYRKQ